MPVNPPASRQSGFSLIELLIGMLIALEILVVALTVFDVHNRMARLQLQITDMQQSLRVAQYDMVRTTRMAGRGGLPADFRVDPDDLNELNRLVLREAFKQAKRLQSRLQLEYRL